MIVLLFYCALAFHPTDVPEWGGFRGNNGAGHADATALPESFAKQDAAWRTELPSGYSSPAVAGDAVFVTAAEGEELLTLCFERASGELRWRKALTFDGKRTGANSPAASSPATDGERVYALFHNFGLIAYDMQGAEVWRHPFGPFNIPHGLSTSPVLHGEHLFVQVDQDAGSYLVAFDRASGKEAWKVDRPGVNHGYSTPAVYKPMEGPAQIITSSSLQVSAYSANDGQQLWWMDGSAWQTTALPVLAGDVCYVSAYATPSSEFGMPKMTQTWKEVLAERDGNGDEKVGKDEWENEMMQQAWFVFDLNDDGFLDQKDYEYMASSASATGGLFALRTNGEGNVTEKGLAWKFKDRRGLPNAASPLALDGLLYMIKEGGLLTAVDLATGEVVKQGRVGEPDDYYASPVAAAGRIITTGKSGQLALIQAGPEWKVLSVSLLEEDVWATPAIAGGEVFIRSEEALYCFRPETK